MSLPFFLALRYLKGRNKFFFNFWSAFSVLGIFFGVFSILVASSFMDGLKQVMMDELLQKRAHIIIKSSDGKFGEDAIKTLEETSEIASFSPVIYTQGLLKFGQKSQGVLVCGIDLQQQKEILPFLKGVSARDLSDQQLVLSKTLARDLDVLEQDLVNLYSTQNTQKTAFGRVPVAARLKVASSYLADGQILADNLVYVSLASAKKIAGQTANSQLELHLQNAYDVKKVVKTLRQNLGEKYKITGWNEEDKAIYDSLKIEAIALNFVLFLIIILAIFNMSGNFLRLANEKSGEIGVLKSMGIRQNQIMKIFIYCGLCIAGFGQANELWQEYFFDYCPNTFILRLGAVQFDNHADLFSSANLLKHSQIFGEKIGNSV